MGILDVFRKREEPQQEPEIRQVKADNLTPWLEKTLSGEITDVRSRAQKIRSDILDSFRSISESAENLRGSMLHGNERIYTSANMLKDTFVKKTMSLSRDVYDHQGTLDRVSLRDFHEKASDAIREMKKTTPKQAVFLSRYFKKDSERVVQHIKEAEERVSSLKSFLEGDFGASDFVGDVERRMREIERMEQERRQNEARIEEMKDRVAYLKRLKEEKEKEFLELLKDRRWKKINEYEKEISGLKIRSMDTEMDIRNRLSEITRPMKKLEHDAKSLSKSDRENINRFIKEPFAAYMSDGGEGKLSGILKLISDSMIAGEIELKESDADRIRFFLKEGSRLLSEERKRLLDSRDEIEGIAGKMAESAPVAKKKDALEEDVRNHLKEQKNVEESIKRVISANDGIIRDIDRKKSELESMVVEKTGNIVRIAY